MEILIALFKYFPYGGLQSDARRIVEEAVRRGHKVTVLTTAWNASERPKGAVIEEIPFRGMTNTARMEAFAEDFQRRAAGWKGVTLTMNRLPGADFYFAGDACLKARLPQKPFWWMKRFLPRYRAVLAQEAKVFSAKEKTRFLLISEKQRREFLEQYPDLPEDRYELISPGIDERAHRHSITDNVRSELRAECGADESDVLLLTVGTNLKLKGVERLLSVLRELPENVRYAVIGNDRPKAFSALCRRHGISSGKAVFLGPRRNVPDYLCAADMMVHAAMEEGAGSVLLEAVSCGLPVVCTEVCGFSPFIGEISMDCLVEEPYSPKKLRDVVAKAIEHLDELKEKTRKYASCHDFTGRASMILDFLERR